VASLEIVLCLASVIRAAPPPDRAAPARADGDAAYARFDNEAALVRYQAAVEAEPDDAGARWRLARAHADVGLELQAADEDAARRHYRQGLGAARRAVELDPDCANAHFFVAVCAGRLALLEGARARIQLSREVRAEAERTLALDPGHDGACHVLGRWNLELATLGWLQRALAKVVYGGVPPGASLEEAAEMLERAIALDPRRPVHHLEYARVLVAQGRLDQARLELRACLDLPRVQWDDPIHKADAARLLERIQPAARSRGARHE
jgi:tetratricopeptide (TPR) repeat protein